MIFHRHYRIAAEDFREPTKLVDATEGSHLAEQAERDLREDLSAGDFPDVVLLTPERALIETVHPGGRIPDPVFAWQPDSDWLHTWLHAPHALAELWACKSEPDPFSPEYAEHGAVLLHDPRIVRLHVSPWLAPVADQLRDQLGVEIKIAGGPDVPAPDVPNAEAVRLPGVLPVEICTSMWDYYCDQDYESARPLYQTAGPAVPIPSELDDVVTQLIDVLAQHYALPADAWQGALVCYGEGERFPRHTDAFESLSKTLDRTVSLTAMLAQPGEDFTGGDLIVDGQPVQLEQGDVVGFTARTPHEVTAVESGHRLVLVVFGEVRR